jgi:hypothetical protein
MEAIHRLDLSARLNERRWQTLETWVEFLGRFDIPLATFQRVLTPSGYMPSQRVLFRISQALGLPQEVVLLKLKPALASQYRLRTSPEMEFRDPIARAENPLTRKLAAIKWDRISPATAEQVLRDLLRFIRQKTPERFVDRRTEELQMDSDTIDHVVRGDHPLPLRAVERLARKLGLKPAQVYLLSRATQISRFADINFAEGTVRVDTQGYPLDEILRLKDQVSLHLQRAQGSDSLGRMAKRFGLDRNHLRRLLRKPFEGERVISSTVEKIERGLGRRGHLWLSLFKGELDRIGVPVEFGGEADSRPKTPPPATREAA